MPGVPDTYQGAELFDISLVDPDNRRPVDWRRRAQLLRRVASRTAAVLDGVAHGTPGTGRVSGGGGIETLGPEERKLAVTHLLLSVRRHLSSLFLSGSYLPLPLAGPARDDFVAFARVHGETALITVARLASDTDRKAVLHLPATLAEGRYTDLLTGSVFDFPDGNIELGPLLARLPALVLLRQAS
jgi:(1->4)-alpha-D-glucan 1-alpha-D-glucosylmutase